MHLVWYGPWKPACSSTFSPIQCKQFSASRGPISQSPSNRRDHGLILVSGSRFVKIGPPEKSGGSVGPLKAAEEPGSASSPSSFAASLLSFRLENFEWVTRRCRIVVMFLLISPRSVSLATRESSFGAFFRRFRRGFDVCRVCGCACPAVANGGGLPGLDERCCNAG